MKKLLVTGGSGFIGTNLIEKLRKDLPNFSFVNIDIKPPKLDEHSKYWRFCDINDYKKLESIIKEYNPQYLIHLAAEADVSYSKISDFKTNIVGVENICKVVNQSDSIRRVIFTSTQYVHQFHGQPKGDEEYYPFTIYGQSKVEGEKIVRNFGLHKVWTIIRPTNIYGPYNDVYVKGLFNVISKGLYFHPNKNVKRSYGFVGNIIEQIINILFVNEDLIACKTFYVSDEPVWLLDFVENIHKNLDKTNVKKLPVWLFYLAAVIGEISKKINIRFPMDMIRFTNMVTPNPIDLDNTYKVLGKGKYSFEESIKITIDWYKSISNEQAFS